MLSVRIASEPVLRMTCRCQASNTSVAAIATNETTIPCSAASVRLPSARSSTALNRSEEHTSELQSRENLVCRLLLEKKKNKNSKTKSKDNTQYEISLLYTLYMSLTLLSTHSYLFLLVLNHTPTTQFYTLSLHERSSDLAAAKPATPA